MFVGENDISNGTVLSTMETRFPVLLCTFLMAVALAKGVGAQTSSGQSSTPAADETPNVLTMNVRRVVVDVVVTDAKGAPVPGLTAGDFKVTEDGKDQRIVAFDANGFSEGMDYVPPALPPQPPNTFIDLPKEPEKGPLYVLLLDLVNIDSWDQMNSSGDHSEQLFARQKLDKFIQEKPEGTRFAIFVRSDGLHLVQGFTSDKEALYRAIDPHHPRPHVPAVFLNSANFGRGDRISALNVLHTIATYLDGLPGRKNLIWVSSQFPVSLFASDDNGPSFEEETKETLNLLAQDQIAVYPVDARGVAYQDSHSMSANSPHSDTITSPAEAGSGAGGGPGGAVGNSPSASSSFVQGSSVVNDSYNVMDGIARETGGEAFYGFNDVDDELVKATENGGSYYTLTYAPANQDYDGKLRQIHVELLEHKGDQISYRRAYYGTESAQPTTVAAAVPAEAGADGEVAADAAQAAAGHRLVGDSLSANMQPGAPEEHQLVFVVQAHTDGAAVMGTPQEMAELATEPAYFKSRRRSAPPKLLTPIPLQKDVFDFNIPTRQFAGEAALHLELAAAAYDADGNMMNAFVRVADKDLTQAPGAAKPSLFFRVEQGLEVPEGAASLRFAVRDVTNDRMGAMEVTLPLAVVSAKR
jgi:VWFA-related protein